MDKDIYGGVADSRPLRRHNPTLGGKGGRKGKPARWEEEKEKEQRMGGGGGEGTQDGRRGRRRNKGWEEEREKEQSAVCHPLNSWELQQRHDFEQSGLKPPSTLPHYHTVLTTTTISFSAALHVESNLCPTKALHHSLAWTCPKSPTFTAACSALAERNESCLGNGQAMHQGGCIEGTCTRVQIWIAKTLSVF